MGSKSAEPFRVAIIGGGIGGLFCALSLNHHCKSDNIAVDVYEQASHYSEIGAGVGIGVNAAKLLHRIGLGDAMNNIAGDRKGVWISFRRYDNGGDIVTVPSPSNDQQQIRQLPVHRAEFLQVLLNAVREREAATLHTKKICRKVEEDGEVARIHFRDGTSATANLVVGCDGIHSSLRAQFAPENPTYSGRIAYRGLVPTSKIEAWWPFQTYSVSWLCKDKHFFVFPISQNQTVNIVAFVSTPEEKLGGLRESWTSTGERSQLAKDFEDFEETVRKVIECMDEKPSKWILNDREPLEQWVWASGKVVLMGDAAHAMLPHQGAGAGQAIEDGYILGRALHDCLTSRGNVQNWANLYQDVRLPRAQKAQRTAREAGDVYEMQAEGLKGVDYDACLPKVRDRLKDRMKWVWSEEIDDAYESEKAKMAR